MSYILSPLTWFKAGSHWISQVALEHMIPRLSLLVAEIIPMHPSTSLRFPTVFVVPELNPGPLHSDQYPQPISDIFNFFWDMASLNNFSDWLQVCNLGASPGHSSGTFVPALGPGYQSCIPSLTVWVSTLSVEEPGWKHGSVYPVGRAIGVSSDPFSSLCRLPVCLGCFPWTWTQPHKSTGRTRGFVLSFPSVSFMEVQIFGVWFCFSALSIQFAPANSIWI